jgi:hypothetical protein
VQGGDEASGWTCDLLEGDERERWDGMMARLVSVVSNEQKLRLLAKQIFELAHDIGYRQGRGS